MNFKLQAFSHPILSCSEASEWEKGLLKDEAAAWKAMKAVGGQLAAGIRQAYAMTRLPQDGITLLGLVGKGHNGGDALLAIGELAQEKGFVGKVYLALSAAPRDLKPNTRKALELLEGKVDMERLGLSELPEVLAKVRFDLCLDGLLGMQFKPPLRDAARKALAQVNGCDRIGCRMAVDLPSGVGDEGAFEADFTFATDIYKTPLLSQRCCGVTRYLDIGFFDDGRDGNPRVLTDRILDPLRRLRPAHSEKRQHGHLAVLAGSRQMPGALAMCVRSALQSGVGLVTVFAPESVASQFAVSMPEAMWRVWPESPEGGLALEGAWQIRSIEDKASALLIGPGMGSDRETQVLLQNVVEKWDKGLVVDADALRPEVLEARSAFDPDRTILTPHAGEFGRIADGRAPTDANVVDAARRLQAAVVLKGSSTRIATTEGLFVNPTGNPVLARGGSGDLLAGLLAGLLAQSPSSSAQVACAGVYWHGKAADALARSKGQIAVRTTDLLDFLPEALEYGE